MSDSKADEARVGEMCRLLRLPAVRRDAGRLSAEMLRQGGSPLSYLRELLETECRLSLIHI